MLICRSASRPKSRPEDGTRLPPFGLTRLSESLGRKGDLVELYQAEWCPHSHKVRQRLTELGLDFWTRQVAADPSRRQQMRQHVGTDEIPVLVPDDASRSAARTRSSNTCRASTTPPTPTRTVRRR